MRTDKLCEKFAKGETTGEANSVFINITEVRNSWKNHKDFKERKKNIGKHKIYLFYGTKRGGVIIIRLNYKGNFLNYDDKIYFLNYVNALNIYKNLKTIRDVIELMSINS